MMLAMRNGSVVLNIFDECVEYNSDLCSWKWDEVKWSGDCYRDMILRICEWNVVVYEK